MWQGRIAERVRAGWGWFSLDGRLAIAQPWPLAAGALALALGLTSSSRWLLYLAYAHLLLVALAYLWVRLLGPRLELRRHMSAQWAQVGDELEEQWELANPSPLPLIWLEVDDESTIPGYSARRVVAAAAGERAVWRTALRCERRGVYRVGPHSARTGDPLGLFRFNWRQDAARELTIYPPLVRLPPLPLPHGRRGGLARADLLQIFATPNVSGVREYVPGDPPGRIHWPLAAHHGRLVVKTFDQERAGALWVALDLAAAAYPEATVRTPEPEAGPVYTQSSVVEAAATTVRPASLADLAVIVAGSVAAAALAEGRSVGLIADDGRRRLVRPGAGSRQLWRILGELVDCAPSGALSLAELLGSELAGRGNLSGASVVVVTGDLGAAWLGALTGTAGGRPVGSAALLVAPSASAAAPCEAALASAGVATRSFEVGASLPLASPPRRRVAARVSPLGRIIKLT